MSQKKIRTMKTKKPKMLETSPREVLMAELRTRRNLDRTLEAQELGDAIADGRIDPKQLEDYKYIMKASKEMGWSVGRLSKAIERINIRQLIKDEEEQDEADKQPS